MAYNEEKRRRKEAARKQKLLCVFSDNNGKNHCLLKFPTKKELVSLEFEGVAMVLMNITTIQKIHVHANPRSRVTTVAWQSVHDDAFLDILSCFWKWNKRSHQELKVCVIHVIKHYNKQCLEKKRRHGESSMIEALASTLWDDMEVTNAKKQQEKEVAADQEMAQALQHSEVEEVLGIHWKGMMKTPSGLKENFQNALNTLPSNPVSNVQKIQGRRCWILQMVRFVVAWRRHRFRLTIRFFYLFVFYAATEDVIEDLTMEEIARNPRKSSAAQCALKVHEDWKIAEAAGNPRMGTMSAPGTTPKLTHHAKKINVMDKMFGSLMARMGEMKSFFKTIADASKSLVSKRRKSVRSEIFGLLEQVKAYKTAGYAVPGSLMQALQKLQAKQAALYKSINNNVGKGLGSSKADGDNVVDVNDDGDSTVVDKYTS